MEYSPESSSISDTSSIEEKNTSTGIATPSPISGSLFSHRASASQLSSSKSSPITFTNILGQGRINQLGGVFINGRPLPTSIRIKIIEMATNGVKPCQISRLLRVSHGAVSKILNRYAETGSICPGQIGGTRSRIPIQAIEAKLVSVFDTYPTSSASELRNLLIECGTCTRSTAPSVSSLARFIRSRRSSSTISKEMKKIPHSIHNILGIDAEEEKSPPTSQDDEYSEMRRVRTSFTSEQLEILENSFKANSYPDCTERDRLVEVTELCEDRIMTWFSNRRARCRKNLPFMHQSLFSERSAFASSEKFSLLPIPTSTAPLLLSAGFLYSPTSDTSGIA